MPKHVRSGDQVIITSGSLKGTIGEVMRVDASNDRVFIKGVNLRTKNIRRTQQNPQGGVITKEAPIHISNVSPVVDGRPTRVRFEVKEDGSKQRVAARGGKVLGEVRGAKKK